jgi:hypothetical protein
MKGVQKYEIEGDPAGAQYITEREAMAAKTTRGLPGKVQPVK